MGGRGSAGRTLTAAPRAGRAPGSGAAVDTGDIASRVEHGLASAHRKPIVAGAQGGVKEQLTLPDGSRVFSKSFSPGDKDAQRITDAEELGALVAAVIEAPVPRAYRRGDQLRVFTEWVDGTALYTARRRRNGKQRADAMLDSPAAQRLGLLDVLTDNHDRHETNLLVDKDEHLVGIDQGVAWNAAHWLVAEPRHAENRVMGFMQGPGRRHFGRPGRHTELGPNPLTPGDVAELRRRLTALRPAFERRGRGEWLAASLLVLNLLENHASGTKSIFAD